MRIFTSRWRRPLDRLAISADWVAAGSAREGSSHGGLEVWSMQTGEVVISRKLGWPQPDFALDSTGHLFLADPEQLRMIDLTSGAERPSPVPDVHYPDLALSADGKYLAVTPSLHSSLSVWHRQADNSFESLWQEGPNELHWYFAPTLSPDGRIVAVREFSLGFSAETTKFVLRQTNALRPLHRMTLNHRTERYSLRLTNSALLVSEGKRAINVWNLSEGRLVTTLRNPARKRRLTALAMHPDGDWMATSDLGGSARFWDTRTFRLGLTFSWQLGPLWSLAFSPDGTLAAVGTDDGRVVVWDLDL